MTGLPVPREFFLQDPVTCARDLIGCRLVWNGCSGIIVETEAYAAINDEACHMFFKPSARAYVERNQAGAAYVYLNYGMHWMANVLCKGPERGFVLFRALEPLEGIERMQERRKLTALTALCSGPGKLTKALGIVGSDHEIDLCTDPQRGFCFPPDGTKALPVLKDVRIGISRAQDLLWRFLAKDSQHLSVRATAAAKRVRRA